MNPGSIFPRILVADAEIESLTKTLFDELENSERESLTLAINGEDTHYLRFNQARVRQTGTVSQLSASLTFQTRSAPGHPISEATREIELTGNFPLDLTRLKEALQLLRAEAIHLPPNPFSAWPEGNSKSRSSNSGKCLPLETAAKEVLEPAQGMDFTGIASSGRLIRIVATSTGIFHSFTTDQTTVDFSAISSKGRAFKGEWAGRNWDPESYLKKLHHARSILPILERDPIHVPRGEHRTFLDHAAVGDLIAMLSWGTIGEEAIRQGDSALARIRNGEEAGFSPLVDLTEDFQDGSCPAFNARGELAAPTTVLFKQGKLINTLVNTRSAREYNIPTNHANLAETLRSPRLSGGSLLREHAMSSLGTGLWLSNLHYLNWSDQPAGRITGMTRHACLWVEDGKPVAPIENLRFDDTLFRLLGSEVEAFTQEVESLPETATYKQRELGTTITPGALLKSMRYTL
jgi:predicted Zn-dependent protease